VSYRPCKFFCHASHCCIRPSAPSASTARSTTVQIVQFVVKNCLDLRTFRMHQSTRFSFVFVCPERPV
jgi:hypothetical protein